MKLALLAAIAATSPALGASLYWNANGAGSGSGTWDASTTAVWNPQADFSGTDGVWTQLGGEDVANMFLEAGHTVTVSGTVNANRLELFTPLVQNPNIAFTGGTVNLTGQATIHLGTSQVNNWIDFNSAITGSNGLTVTGQGHIVLGPGKSYTGTTTFQHVRTIDLATSTSLPSTTVLNLLSGTTRVRPAASGLTIAGLTGSASLQGQGGGNATVFLSSNQNVTHTYTGKLSGPRINFVKQGGYTQIFGGTEANGFSAAATVEVQGGVLALAKTAGIDAIGDGAVTLTGGQLRLDQNNQINDATDMNFSGGTFNLNGFDETLDIATLTANSSIDFGTDGSILSLSQLLRTGGVLTINNWDGSPNVGGGLDQLRVTSLPDADVLSNIVFSNYQANAIAINFGSYFEIVPEVVSVIPEPAAGMLLAAGSLLSLRRGRRAREV
jgi:hypothetical protein